MHPELAFLAGGAVWPWDAVQSDTQSSVQDCAQEAGVAPSRGF